MFLSIYNRKYQAERLKISPVEAPLRDYIVGVMYIVIEEMDLGIKLVTTKGL